MPLFRVCEVSWRLPKYRAGQRQLNVSSSRVVFGCGHPCCLHCLFPAVLLLRGGRQPDHPSSVEVTSERAALPKEFVDQCATHATREDPRTND